MFRSWILSFGWFQGVWILYDDVSELSVPSILAYITYEDETECSETSEYKIHRRKITQKKEYNIQNTVKFWYQEFFEVLRTDP